MKNAKAINYAKLNSVGGAKSDDDYDNDQEEGGDEDAENKYLNKIIDKFKSANGKQKFNLTSDRACQYNGLFLF